VRSNSRPKRTLVVGVGNLLLKDEGVGIHAVRRLEQMQLPDHVQLIDAGTSAIDFISDIQNADKVIFVDAVKAGGEPGSIYRLTKEDIAARTGSQLSLHEIGVLEALNMAECLGGCGEVVIIGIEPKEMTWGMELSSELESKLPELIECVLTEIG